MERGGLQSEGKAGLQPLRRLCPRCRPKGGGENLAPPSTSLSGCWVSYEEGVTFLRSTTIVACGEEPLRKQDSKGVVGTHSLTGPAYA